MITQELVRELFSYEDGIFVWKKQLSYRGKIGKKAGSLSNTGYIQIGIKNMDYLLHRLVFLYHHGYMPKYIDHIDGNKLNNRIENLRECTNQQNSFNSKISKNNTSGIKGISWDKSRNKWQAKCMIDGKTIHIGRFSDIKQAENALKSARSYYHGIYARHN